MFRQEKFRTVALKFELISVLSVNQDVTFWNLNNFEVKYTRKNMHLQKIIYSLPFPLFFAEHLFNKSLFRWYLTDKGFYV